MTRFDICAAVFVIATTLAATAPAYADQLDLPTASKTVALNDIDLSTRQGQDKAHERIVAAADQACREVVAADNVDEQIECSHRAVRNASMHLWEMTQAQKASDTRVALARR